MNEETINITGDPVSTDTGPLTSKSVEYTEEEKVELEKNMRAYRTALRNMLRPGQKKVRNKMSHLIPKKKKRK